MDMVAPWPPQAGRPVCRLCAIRTSRCGLHTPSAGRKSHAPSFAPPGGSPSALPAAPRAPVFSRYGYLLSCNKHTARVCVFQACNLGNRAPSCAPPGGSLSTPLAAPCSPAFDGSVTVSALMITGYKTSRLSCAPPDGGHRHRRPLPAHLPTTTLAQ